MHCQNWRKWWLTTLKKRRRRRTRAGEAKRDELMKKKKSKRSSEQQCCLPLDCLKMRSSSPARATINHPWWTQKENKQTSRQQLHRFWRDDRLFLPSFSSSLMLPPWSSMLLMQSAVYGNHLSPHSDAGWPTSHCSLSSLTLLLPFTAVDDEVTAAAAKEQQLHCSSSCCCRRRQQ